MISMKNNARGVKKELLGCVRKNNVVSSPQYTIISHGSSEAGSDSVRLSN